MTNFPFRVLDDKEKTSLRNKIDSVVTNVLGRQDTREFDLVFLAKAEPVLIYKLSGVLANYNVRSSDIRVCLYQYILHRDRNPLSTKTIAINLFETAVLRAERTVIGLNKEAIDFLEDVDEAAERHGLYDTEDDEDESMPKHFLPDHSVPVKEYPIDIKRLVQAFVEAIRLYHDRNGVDTPKEWKEWVENINISLQAMVDSEANYQQMLDYAFNKANAIKTSIEVTPNKDKPVVKDDRLPFTALTDIYDQHSHGSISRQEAMSKIKELLVEHGLEDKIIVSGL